MNTFVLRATQRFFCLCVLFLIIVSGCKRSVVDLRQPDYSTDPNVFIDGFSSGLNYAAFGGSVPAAFQVDKTVTYNNSSASMRIEVPDANDPRGAYAGGVYFTSTPRDLSGYDALTFWAKASGPDSIGVVGIGNDLGASKYEASVNGIQLNTNWKKYYIPLPDPSRLTQERGMFYYSTGPINGKGYTIWIDNVKYEKLGTIAHPKYAILNGQNQTTTGFAGITTQIQGLASIYNLPDGTNESVNITPSYFSFKSSNPNTASVDDSGNVTVKESGTAVITASVGGVDAQGSLTVNSKGVFNAAPIPTDDPANVISLFSDAYTNVPVDYYNGYWAPYQTTQSADFEVNGDHILNYTNFNFVGIQFSSPTIDASSMTHLHLDIYFPNQLPAGATFKVQLVDFGPDGVYGGNDDSNFSLPIASSKLVSQSWIILDIPLSDFSGLKGRAHLGQLIFEGTNISNFYADNIYFHK